MTIVATVPSEKRKLKVLRLVAMVVVAIPNLATRTNPS
jgi:hypothetical protein